MKNLTTPPTPVSGSNALIFNITEPTDNFYKKWKFKKFFLEKNTSETFISEGTFINAGIQSLNFSFILTDRPYLCTEFRFNNQTNDFSKNFHEIFEKKVIIQT